MKIITPVLTVLMLFHAILSFAQAGSLDSSFNTDGKVKKPAGNANAVTVQPDGKIIAGGSSAAGFTLVRYKANGFIDKSFGDNGKAIADFGNDATVNSIALKASGKIIAAGTTGKDFAIAKFNSDGLLDSSFGTNGTVTTHFNGQGSTANFVIIQPDNKILAVGSSDRGSGELTRIALARYNPDGSLDNSFGEGGKIFKHFNDNGFDFGTSIVLQPGGKIVMVGYAFNNRYDFALARYKPNGDDDSSFGTNGSVLTDFGDFDLALGAAVQSDGKIVAAGYSDFFSSKVILARYTKNGKLDSSFGVNGKVIIAFNGISDRAYGIAVQADDKVVIAGASYNGSDNDFALARFRKNGLPDNNFGNDGKVLTDFNNADDIAAAIAIQANGKIIAAGASGGNFALARYKSDASTMNVTADNSSLNIADNNFSSIKAYPNPVKDVLHIAGLKNGNNTITILNAEGKLVKQAIAENQTYDLNIKQLPAGIYYLHIEKNNSSGTQDKKISSIKFIKQ